MSEANGNCHENVMNEHARTASCPGMLSCYHSRIRPRPIQGGSAVISPVWQEAVRWPNLQPISVALGSEPRPDHENDLFLVVDFVEKTVIPDAVAPGLGGISLQLLDVLPKKGLLLELRINIFFEFSNDLPSSGAEDLPEILMQLLGLEYPEITQRTGPSSCGLGRFRLSFSSTGSRRT